MTGLYYEIIRKMIISSKKKGFHSSGLSYVVVGVSIVMLGNMASVIPGNIFPYDTLSGVMCSLLILYSLYKKKTFGFRIFASKASIIFLSIVSSLGIVYLSYDFICSIIVQTMPMMMGYEVVFASVLSLILLIIFYYILKFVVYNIVGKKDKIRSASIEKFTTQASYSLETTHILGELEKTIVKNIKVANAYIWLREDNVFVCKHNGNPLKKFDFVLLEKNPIVRALQAESKNYFMVDEFLFSPLGKSIHDRETNMLLSINASHISAIKLENKIIGIIMLPEKYNGGEYTFEDLQFISTVSNIACMSINNSLLYEQLYYESRYDSVTNLLNYRSFTQKIDEEIASVKNQSSLVLAFVDIDDFKLYNQLYGIHEGDMALKAISGIMGQTVGKNGDVFRYNGKVFAIMLPDYDILKAARVLETIQEKIGNINSSENRKIYKSLSVSCGVCLYPHNARTKKDLINNADFATFRAKRKGKNHVYVYSSKQNNELVIVGDQVGLNDGNNKSLYSEHEPMVHALSAAIDAKDNYTSRHSKNVSLYASKIAKAVNMNDEYIQMVYEAGLLHDIGKISIPERILCSDQKLTKEEYEVMKSHVTNSIEMIRHLPSMDYVVPAVLHHHERYDGGGYPHGTKGENIPLSARCLMVADAFDAMTTDRPYSAALSIEQACNELTEHAGTQFDPQLAELFRKLVESGEMLVGAEIDSK